MVNELLVAIHIMGALVKAAIFVGTISPFPIRRVRPCRGRGSIWCDRSYRRTYPVAKICLPVPGRWLQWLKTDMGLQICRQPSKYPFGTRVRTFEDVIE